MRLINPQTGVERSLVASHEGVFVFQLLPPGDYALQVTSPGMAVLRRTGLRVEVEGELDLAFPLEVAGTRETVNVSDVAPSVETLPTGTSSVVDERAIADLPLNGRRFSDLALLTPGVTQDPRSLTSGSNGDLAFGASAASRPASWLMASKTTTPSSARNADATAPLTSSRTK